MRVRPPQKFEQYGLYLRVAKELFLLELDDAFEK